MRFARRKILQMNWFDDDTQALIAIRLWKPNVTWNGGYLYPQTPRIFVLPGPCRYSFLCKITYFISLKISAEKYRATSHRTQSYLYNHCGGPYIIYLCKYTVNRYANEVYVPSVFDYKECKQKWPKILTKLYHFHQNRTYESN